MDYDDSKIDDDLDKLLQHIKEEQQNSMVLIINLIYFLQNIDLTNNFFFIFKNF